MTNIIKCLPSYIELKQEIEQTPEKLSHYAKYDSFIGEEKAVDYLIDKLLEDDTKSNVSAFEKIIKFLTKKYHK